MRPLFLLALLLAALWGARHFGAGEAAREAGVSAPAERAWEAREREIEARYGIAIDFDHLEFPADWMGLDPRWTPVPPHQRGRALDGLEIDLAHYDPAFLRLHLSRVFLFESLAFSGHAFGGTNDHRSRWLYLQQSWLGDAGHDYAMGFHHELSSILLKLRPAWFREGEWRAANRTGFRYAFGTSSPENLASGRTGMQVDAGSIRAGFVAEYGQLTLEDDFNTYAQYWIAKPDRLSALGEAHPPVARKAAILARFFHDIGFVRQGGA